MMIIFLLLIPALCQASLGSEVTYSRACVAGQCGDWQRAQQQMSHLVIDNPDRAELLYDNGVAAFRLQEFQKAGAYFEDVTKKADAPVPLKKQAYFNLGNTKVALNELPAAIQQYEAVLKIDPNDERAKYNLEKVRALLAQQQQQEKQQEQNQDQDKQDQNQSQEQNQDQQGDSSQQKNSGQQKSKQQEGNQDKDKKQNQGSSSSQEKQNGEQQDSSQGQGQGNQSDQSEQDSSKQKNNGAAKDDQQGDQEDQADSRSAGQDQDQKQDQLGSGHDNSPEGDEKKDDARNVASQQDKKQDSDKQEQSGTAASAADDRELNKDRRSQELAQTQQKFAPNEQWMARLLQRQDKADEQANKRLIKTTVDKNMTGKYGQNNW